MAFTVPFDAVFLLTRFGERLYRSLESSQNNTLFMCMCMCLFVCVCVCVFIKLHMTAQSGLVILVILCHSR